MDENWHQEYAHLYNTNPNIKPYVKRLILSHGICNLRPIFPRDPRNHRSLSSNISETYLAPPPNMDEKNNCFIKCLGNYDAYGTSVTCVPYIMPNPYFGVCIQAAVWICFKILEEKSGRIVSAYSIPKIQEMATGHPFSDSVGLVFPHVNRIFQMNCCQSFIYNSFRMNLTDEEMINIIYAYVESKLPVIIGVDVSKLKWWDHARPGYHAIVLIGHTIDKRTGKINGFIVHDESKYPYLKISRNELLKAWDIPERNKSSRREKHRVAVVGTPPGVIFGYESALEQRVFLDFLYQRGIIKNKDFALWPKLYDRISFLRWWKRLEFKQPKFRKFADDRLKKTQLSDYVWALRLFESEKKRLERPLEFDGLLLVDATKTGKLLFLTIENQCVLYFSEKDQKFILDTYPSRHK